MAEHTVFAEIHKELDAKMIPAGKFQMPLSYPGGTLAEHRHTCKDASIFDLSNERCFQTAGKNAAAILNDLFLREVSSLPVSGAMENCLLYENGSVAGIFLLTRMQEDDFMLRFEGGTPDKAVRYMISLLSKSLTVNELSGAMGFLSVAGKRSREILENAGAANIPECGAWSMDSLTDPDGEKLKCIIIGRKRFGQTAFDICCNAQLALEIYGALYRVNGVEPAGCAAWDSLHAEYGVPRVPQEIREDALPGECGLGAWVDMSRKFNGSSALAASQPAMQLFLAETGRSPAPAGTAVKLAGGITAGTVTGGAFCPVSGNAHVFCLIDCNAGVKAGSELFFRSGDKEFSGKVLAEVLR